MMSNVVEFLRKRWELMFRRSRNS